MNSLHLICLFLTSFAWFEGVCSVEREVTEKQVLANTSSKNVLVKKPIFLSKKFPLKVWHDDREVRENVGEFVWKDVTKLDKNAENSTVLPPLRQNQKIPRDSAKKENRQSQNRPTRVLAKSKRTNYRRKSKRPFARRVKGKSSRCSPSTQISCSGKCISVNSICDGIKDCRSGRDEANCSELKVGLKGGKKRGEGRVEITMNDFEGSVCGKDWRDNEAAVYCRMLGYSNGGKGVLATKAGFGSGSKLVWNIQYNCQGSEQDLFECPLVKRTTRCFHRHDAAVVCHEAPKSTKPTKTPPSNLQCGVKLVKHMGAKVLGGETATYGSQPWQARLLLKVSLRHLCGASIINNQWVITAAHCLRNLKDTDVAVLAGDHSLTVIDGEEQLFSVEKSFLHPMFKQPSENDYFIDPFDNFFSNPFLSFFSFKAKGKSSWQSRATASSFKYDIALLKLTSYKKWKKHPNKIVFNKHVQPICLPDQGTPYTTGLECEISGWGHNGKSKKGSLQLQVAKLSLIRQDKCEKAYGPMFFDKLPSQMVCAGDFRKATDTCQGDSGGPLACKVNGVHTLMGVTSWGFECDDNRAPGIYTKVGVLRDWIDKVVLEN